MKIHSVRLQHLRMEMKEPFETSFGVEKDKEVILVSVQTKDGGQGYGECVASALPLYGEETNGTVWHMLRDIFIPAVMDLSYHSQDDLHMVRDRLKPFKRNSMAKAALEMAIWDAYANETGTPLVQLLGGVKNEIPVGISVGIQPTIEGFVQKVAGYVEQGFRRIKVKVRPGYDIAPLAAIRKAFPDILLMADANSAYRLSDIQHLKQFDSFNLMMIEQPLSHDDIVDHARLQAELNTPICLDESIHSEEDVRKAAHLGACKVVNLKLGRVGGFSEALHIHDACKELNLDLWCGGMLETGIGRLHNVAITSLPGFTMPGDTAPSARYFEEDLIDPPVVFSRPGFLAVEPLCGVASRVNTDRIQKWVIDEYFQKYK